MLFPQMALVEAIETRSSDRERNEDKTDFYFRRWGIWKNLTIVFLLVDLLKCWEKLTVEEEQRLHYTTKSLKINSFFPQCFANLYKFTGKIIDNFCKVAGD